MMEHLLIKLASDPAYQTTIDLMATDTTRQLFTSYVKQGMANKYGRWEEAINDVGIYYEDGQPQYALVAITSNSPVADNFIELLNLRVNEYFHAQHQ